MIIKSKYTINISNNYYMVIKNQSGKNPGLKIYVMRVMSDDALTHHGVGNFHEAGDVGAFHVVDIAVGLRAVFEAL